MTRLSLLIGTISLCLVAALLFLVAEDAKAEGSSVSIACKANWNAAAGATGYRVYVGATATAKTQRAQVTTPSVDCADLNLSAGQQYIHVTAFNVAGESGPSTSLPFVLVSAPAAPTGLSLSP